MRNAKLMDRSLHLLFFYISDWVNTQPYGISDWVNTQPYDMSDWVNTQPYDM